MKGSPYDDMACACCRAFFEGKYAELDAELFSRHREAFPRETFTLDAFLWAVATVRSRVHSPLDGDLRGHGAPGRPGGNALSSILPDAPAAYNVFYSPF